MNILQKLTQFFQFNKNTQIHTQGLKAESGAVVAAQIAEGAEVTVNNISVSADIVQRYAAPLNLSPEKAQAVSREFLSDIETYYRYLPLKGMGDNSGLRLKFPLVDLFVPLNARLTLPAGDTLADGLRNAGRRLTEEEREGIGGKLDDLKPVLELLQEHPVLVILGDPGSGKSTVVRYMAYALATGQSGPFGLSDYLPLLLPLSAYSEALDQQSDLSLRRFAVTYFSSRMDVSNLDTLLDTYLERGRVLILLDGLDEVKEVSQRNLVVDRVQAFLSRYIRSGNRAIMTSRIIGYQEVRPPEIADLRECTLLDFEPEEVEAFIRRWTKVVETQAHESQRAAQFEAEREAAELLEAVEENSAVGKLAANPLLLTMLVIQKRQGSSLPRHRVVLYERYVTSLLSDWLRARNVHATQCALPNERSLRRMLEPLAWWMQESEPGKGLVGEAALLQWLRQQPGMDGDEDKAYQFIRDVRENSGLLIDRGGRKFGFFHLTFMEYLAGVWLAKQIQYPEGEGFVVETVQRYADVSEWHEVLLLAIGHIGLNQNQEVVTTRLLQRLMQHKSESGALQVIAAAALADIGEDGISPESVGPFQQELVAQVTGERSLVAKQRVAIGRSLGVFGDPRPEANSVDGMRFCYVPAGPFYMGRGESDDEKEEWLSEAPAGDYDLSYAYWLAQHPVTVAQFAEFVTATGFVLEFPKALRRAANAPIVDITQREAQAFCTWLMTCWRKRGWLKGNWRVALPNEPEWEKAARGGAEISTVPLAMTVSDYLSAELPLPPIIDNPEAQRRHPWGNKMGAECVNYYGKAVSISTVGAYPLGSSPYGCHDLVGNVWEWTRSESADYPYPAVSTVEWDQRERDAVPVVVLRGGAFGDDFYGVRCAVRGSRGADSRRNGIGFRVVLSPLL